MEKGGCECCTACRNRETARCWDVAALREGLGQLVRYPHRPPQPLCQQREDSVLSQMIYLHAFGRQQTSSLVV